MFWFVSCSDGSFRSALWFECSGWLHGALAVPFSSDRICSGRPFDSMKVFSVLLAGYTSAVALQQERGFLQTNELAQANSLSSEELSGGDLCKSGQELCGNKCMGQKSCCKGLKCFQGECVGTRAACTKAKRQYLLQTNELALSNSSSSEEVSGGDRCKSGQELCGNKCMGQKSCCKGLICFEGECVGTRAACTKAMQQYK